MDKLDKKRVILKIGSNTLTKNTANISRGKIEDIARQIHKLKDKYEFIIVSSGAIATAKQFVKLHDKSSELNVKQALASIGQPILMEIYSNGFADIGLKVSQCLLSYNDFENTISKVNIINTIDALLANDYIPIINENDTVATEEIKFGDNDKLASLSAVLLNADLLILATNTNGIYSKKSIENNNAETITNITNIEDLKAEVIDKKSVLGTGGMKSKIEALKITKAQNIETWIVNGLEDSFVLKAFNNESSFSKSI